jgi:hypothetical protein
VSGKSIIVLVVLRLFICHLRAVQVGIVLCVTLCHPRKHITDSDEFGLETVLQNWSSLFYDIVT